MKLATIARTSLALAVAFTVVGAAAPAAAAGRSLPTTDTLYTVACEDGGVSVGLYEVDAPTGASTLVGELGTGTSCGYDPAYDFATGDAYTLVYNYETYHSDLLKIDVKNGTVLSSVAVTLAGELLQLDAFTIDKGGVAYGVAPYGTLYRVDLATGVAEELGVVPGIEDEIYAMATHPVTGALYAFEEGGALFSINPADLTATYVDTFAQLDVSYVWGLDIDSNGTFWAVTYQIGPDDYLVPGLWSFELSDVNGTALESGLILDQGESFYTFTALIVPTTLAATGFNAMPLLAGAAAFGVLGLALLLMVRRRTA